jgi:hypothetical protein
VPDAAASIGLRFSISGGLLAHCGLAGASHRWRGAVRKASQSFNMKAVRRGDPSIGHRYASDRPALQWQQRQQY